MPSSPHSTLGVGVQRGEIRPFPLALLPGVAMVSPLQSINNTVVTVPTYTPRPY